MQFSSCAFVINVIYLYSSNVLCMPYALTLAMRGKLQIKILYTNSCNFFVINTQILTAQCACSFSACVNFNFYSSNKNNTFCHLITLLTFVSVINLHYTHRLFRYINSKYISHFRSTLELIHKILLHTCRKTKNMYLHNGVD